MLPRRNQWQAKDFFQCLGICGSVAYESEKTSDWPIWMWAPKKNNWIARLQDAFLFNPHIPTSSQTILNPASHIRDTETDIQFPAGLPTLGHYELR
jgi:hypothetical protein